MNDFSFSKLNRKRFMSDGADGPTPRSTMSHASRKDEERRTRLLAASQRIAKGEKAVAKAEAALRAAAQREAEAEAFALKLEMELASGNLERFLPPKPVPKPSRSAATAANATSRGDDESGPSETYNLESFKQHLRDQMAQLPGDLFSGTAPPPTVPAPPEYSTPPPHPAPLSVRRVRPVSATATTEWSPTGRLWGPNHPCLAPRGSPRNVSPRRPLSPSARSWKPETPRRSGARSTYVTQETIEKLLHSW
jgi:hypothetical protein